MLGRFLDFLVGTYTVEAVGNTERFLNELYRRKLKTRALKKTDRLSVSFRIYPSSYKKLQKLCDYTGTRLEILKKNGLPSKLSGFKKRYGLMAGVIIFAVLFYVSSLFIWNCEISGCDATSPQEVMQLLESSGFKTGMLRSSLKVSEIENAFLKNNQKHSWISINLMGTSAYIEVREKEPKPQLLDTKGPCSIYAARDGVIASVNTYMGYSVVKKGDTVTAGDLVVTGNYTDKYGVMYQLHSYAKVMAYTSHSFSVTVPFGSTEHIPTGNSKNKYTIKLRRFDIPLYFSKKIRYNNYDITQSEHKLGFGNFHLPVSIVKTTYTEVEHIPVTKSESVAREQAYEQLYDLEYDLVGIVINDRHYEESSDGKSLTVKAVLDCYEDIGVVGKLDLKESENGTDN